MLSEKIYNNTYFPKIKIYYIKQEKKLLDPILKIFEH